ADRGDRRPAPAGGAGAGHAAGARGARAADRAGSGRRRLAPPSGRPAALVIHIPEHVRQDAQYSHKYVLPANMRIITIIGNRPQFVKAAAVSQRLRERADEVLVHTGQHYDDALSRVFFDELGLPRPEHRLELAGGTNSAQTARMLAALEPLLASEKPDAVLVYGDTNSTLAGALAGAQAGIPVAHVEAGMRSYARTMPEELNRVLTDHAASLLLCSSELAAETLREEQVIGDVVVVGDVMVDVFDLLAPRADGAILGRLGVERGGYLLVTAHRA